MSNRGQIRFSQVTLRVIFPGGLFQSAAAPLHVGEALPSFGVEGEGQFLAPLRQVGEAAESADLQFGFEVVVRGGAHPLRAPAAAVVPSLKADCLMIWITSIADTSAVISRAEKWLLLQKNSFVPRKWTSVSRERRLMPACSLK